MRIKTTTQNTSASSPPSTPIIQHERSGFLVLHINLSVHLHRQSTVITIYANRNSHHCSGARNSQPTTRTRGGLSRFPLALWIHAVPLQHQGCHRVETVQLPVAAPDWAGLRACKCTTTAWHMAYGWWCGRKCKHRICEGIHTDETIIKTTNITSSIEYKV